MTKLTIEAFRDFFREVHGTDPFPWQERLLRSVAERGAWPALLDLPTGTGKTAAIDVALYHLAMEAEAGGGGRVRSAPRRILFVVDRRTIVDQAYHRAQRIREALAARAAPILQLTAEALAGLSHGEDPLRVTVLRGGIARDDAWAHSPDQPLVAVSTVDQVGSRLLFRGYGVSESMQPVHAGLLGNDALFLLDEVHLSQPFCETLQAVAERYRGWAEQPLPDRWQFVQLSATAGAPPPGGAFQLAPEDREHPVLRERLRAARPVELRRVAARAALVADCATLAAQEARDGRAVAVIVNRLATAHETAERLIVTLGNRADVRLVTGRMRPLDRSEVEGELSRRLDPDRPRDRQDRPLVVVSTQCLEAGADFDFDAMVTECASLDALRQRFGRLNRFGRCAEPRGYVLLPGDAAEKDPIYGPALLATWAELEGRAAIDFGIEAFALPPPEALAALLPPREVAPVLLPAHLDTWVQTSPAPWPEPEVALWLHGPRATEPDVQVVWRADIPAELLASARDDTEALARLLDRVEACPPSSREALPVPLSAARRWIRGAGPSAEFGDVEGEAAPDEEAERREDRTAERDGAHSLAEDRLALAWRGEESRVVRFSELRPGDILIVPADYGGLRRGSWQPSAVEPVADLGDRAFATRFGRPLIRLHPRVLPEADFGGGSDPEPAVRLAPPRLLEAEDPEHDERTVLVDWLVQAAEAPAPPWFTAAATHLLRELRSRRRPQIVRVPAALEMDPGYYTVIARARMDRGADEATTEDDSGSFTGAEVTLREHGEGVRARALDFARRCGLSDLLAADVALAAAWHDAGKADPRFQRFLHGGSDFRSRTAPEPIAKASGSYTDRVSRQEARRRSGYPAGARHELVSTVLFEQAGVGGHDPELVAHLIASHHGRCRPLAPVIADMEPVSVRFRHGDGEVNASSRHGLECLDSGVCDRFWALVRRYGWWGLAWIEAILRLADHRCSEAEQRARETAAGKEVAR